MSPLVAYATPRKLPKVSDLEGRLAVLDIAFAAGAGKMSFEHITLTFIQAVGDRLAAWIDHHDHVMHAAYAGDSRFVLGTKAEHPGCPEMITPERVQAAGRVDTVVCHTDFDGLCAAAKWIRGGIEPYAGADQDARVIDTRLGKATELGREIDRALRGRRRDNGLRDMVVSFLAEGASNQHIYRVIREAARELAPLEEAARELARGFEVRGKVALVRIAQPAVTYDKTELLMQGQERAQIAVVVDRNNVTVAARFDSGIDLLEIFEIDGGMPTVVSLPARRLEQVLARLGWR